MKEDMKLVVFILLIQSQIFWEVMVVTGVKYNPY